MALIIPWTLVGILTLLLIFMVWLFTIRNRNAILNEVKMRNRFALIMAAYEEVAYYLEAMKLSKMFDDMMLEHEPMIKTLYEHFDQLADVMWTVFEDEDQIRGDLISEDEEEEDAEKV